MSTNITVNGRPLEEHLSEQAGREIAAVRAADERPVPIRNHTLTKHTRNHSNGRTAPGEVVYQAGQRETHVIVAGNLFLWQDKAPYVRSGHSLLGAVEYDAHTDRVKCATCGEWVQSISHHVQLSDSHETMRDYRLRHGFRLTGSPLASPTLTTKRKARAPAHFPTAHRANGASVARTNGASMAAARQQRRVLGTNPRSETFNLIAKCKAQRLQRLRAIADELGRCPTQKELGALNEGLSDTCLRWLFGVGTRQVLIQAGIMPLSRGQWVTRMRKKA